MLKKCIYSLALLAGFCNAGDFYDVQGNYLNRDLGVPAGYTPASALTEYQKEIVTAAYGITVPGEFTLGDWKTRNAFDTEKNLNAEYYNSADLGLGRNMNCWPQPGLEGARGTGAMACYVSNHGKIGAGHEAAYQGLNCNTREDQEKTNKAFCDAIANTPDDFSKEFATVAMEYWPNDPLNKVRFFVFGSNSAIDKEDGKLVTDLKIALDNGLGHAQPGLCLSCHGGKVTVGTKVVNNKTVSTISIKDAHFLPFDTFSFEFETPEKRLAATPIFDKMNKLVHAAETSAFPAASSTVQNQQIVNFLKGSYKPKIEDANAKMVDTYTPSAFNGNDKDRSLYHTVVKPYCRGCHLASSFELKVDTVGTVCNPNDEMPHAEVTNANLLRHMEFVAYDMDRYANNTNCYTMPHLIDFQHAVPPFTFSARTKANSKINGSGYSTVLAGQDINVSLDGTTPPSSIAAHNTVEGINNHKKALRPPPHESSMFALKKSDQLNSPNITGVSFLALRDGNHGEFFDVGSTLILTNLIGDPGASLSEKSSSLFTKYTADIESVSTFKEVTILNETSVINPNAGVSQITSNWDIDDILVTYAGKQPGAVYQDFESGSFVQGISQISTFESLPGCTSDSSQRFMRVGNLIKPNSDAGRYAYHTPPQLCFGDRFTVVPENFFPPTSKVRKEITFDFVISKKIRLFGVQDINPIVQARINGTLVETPDAFHGRATSNIGARMSFLVLEDSGIDGKPIHGFAIDNIRVITEE